MAERLRGIGVLLDDQPHSDARLELAIAAAGEFEAHLDGIFVELPPSDGPQAVSDSFARGAGIRDAIAHVVEHERAAAVRQRGCLHAAATQLGLTARWRELPAQMTLADAASRMASYDLLFLPPPDGSFDRSPWCAAELVFVGGVSGVVVPRTPLGASFGTRIAVAWNGSNVARRAVADALPLLARANAVEIVVIEKPGCDIPSDDVITLLARHGISASERRIRYTGRNVSDEILAEAATFHADLVVAGAYGHARWAEVVFGSTTRRLLEHAGMPVMIAH